MKKKIEIFFNLEPERIVPVEIPEPVKLPEPVKIPEPKKAQEPVKTGLKPHIEDILKMIKENPSSRLKVSTYGGGRQPLSDDFFDLYASTDRMGNSIKMMLSLHSNTNIKSKE